jgi:hypothetical protein
LLNRVISNNQQGDDRQKLVAGQGFSIQSSLLVAWRLRSLAPGLALALVPETAPATLGHWRWILSHHEQFDPT